MFQQHIHSLLTTFWEAGTNNEINCIVQNLESSNMAGNQLFLFHLKKNFQLLFYFPTLEISFNKMVSLQNSLFSMEYVTSPLWKLACVHRFMAMKYVLVVMFSQYSSHTWGLKYPYNVIIRLACKQSLTWLYYRFQCRFPRHQFQVRYCSKSKPH